MLMYLISIKKLQKMLIITVEMEKMHCKNQYPDPVNYLST